jgi:primosomal protein N' (replication factor Y)
MSLVFPPCVNRNRYLVDKISEVKQSNKQTILLFPNISLVEEFIEFFKNDNLDIKFQVLSAEQEPGIRYESFLTILNNEVDLVLGTRNAVFAPLNNLGLIAMWDDADENYFSQQSPYWNAREVAMIRAELNKCDFYAFGNSESIAINHAVKTNRAKREDFGNYQSSENWPEIFTLDSSTSDPLEKSKRLPKKAWEIIKDGLNKGNVLIQVPRLGYSSNLQCTDCRESARCISCTGPIFIKEKNSAAECKWCGKIASNWKCRFCNNKDFRISVIGQTKTVEELGKSFPGVQIITSGGKTIIREFEGKNSIVVATPGAEPRTSEGYSAAVLLDAYLLLGVPSLAASEEALRKWIHVMTLVKPEQLGGKVFITSESNNRVVQALVKRQPNWLIDKELELRVETNLQPAVTSVSLKGDLEQINQIREKFVNDDSLTILGPRIYEKQDLAQIVIGSKNPEVLTSKLRAEIIKFSASRTKPVRAYVNAYDFE